MSLRKPIFCLALIIAIIYTSMAAEWQDSNTNTAKVVAGNPTTVDSGIKVDINTVESDKSQLLSKYVEHWIVGTNINPRIFRHLRILL